ncbi:MAG: hypothetical protein KTR16_14220 [Acidiferrobacterales bacterium]|nr:hypothetical protein [Acidiferrobacterales bacterium]
MFNKTLKTLPIFAALFMANTSSVSASSLDEVLKAQPEEAQARYEYRNPKETLEFFGIKEGMTVVEALPGGGWYSKILLPTLGEEGKLIGVDYAVDMWSNFSFMTPERIEAKKTWVSTWTEQASEWRDEGSASLAAFQFNALPEDMVGGADAVLYIRALHNLFRFESKGEYLTKALKETHSVLKDDGVVGVVQHQAREDRSDEWADGSNGYVKKSAIIEAFESNGFKLIADSDINNNAKDQANEGDFVWRLPPVLSGSKDDEEKRTAMQAIGESHRMTLLFKKVTS